jgi:hypothetical protein
MMIRKYKGHQDQAGIHVAVPHARARETDVQSARSIIGFRPTRKPASARCSDRERLRSNHRAPGAPGWLWKVGSER